MKPILVPYDENMTKEELLKAIADAAGSDVETVKKELCEPKTEPQSIVIPRKGCHRPIELPCHTEQGDEYCKNCVYWHEDFEVEEFRHMVEEYDADCPWK